MSENLLAKYDVQVPRYTSYPTVPTWHRPPNSQEWIQSLQQSLVPAKAAWSMYVHIPFCETLCTFCGCNNIITKNHQEEHPYVSYVLKEFSKYQEAVEGLKNRPLKMLHLGGGTPTFLSADHLKKLVESILGKVSVSEQEFEGSIEVDPRRTNLEQLKVLQQLGFNRISLGVQDLNEEVQYLINRIQSFEMTQAITQGARDLGYQSVNFDLIYGLPKQSLDRMVKTIEKTILLSPDRIAFYSFALVPWIKPQQRLFKDDDLPVGAEKRKLYEVGRDLLLKAGYVEIGMDHFAKPTDALSRAFKSQSLHRNFMGYTDQYTDVLLGVGVSSISESKTMFHQNEKVYAKYKESLDLDQWATHRGHILSDLDQKRRKQILKFITTSHVEVDAEDFELIQKRLSPMIADGLVEMHSSGVRLRPEGKPFLRNACSAFDEYYQAIKDVKPTFSKSI
jgi:oxygen-independent coproporphyrinogen-3 oxidase